MPSFVAAHQLEIRFSHIMDFPSISKRIFAPIISMADNIGIDKENTINERITAGVEEEGYVVSAMADRLIYRSEGLADLAQIAEKNSVVESVVFNIFTRLKELPTFGRIKNVLCVTNFVEINDEAFDRNVKRFKSVFLSDVVNSIAFNDAAITLENSGQGTERTIQFGPYKGVEDLTKRKITINKNFRELAEKSGYMSEVKVYDITANFGFQDYKKMVQEAIKLNHSIVSKTV